MIPFALACYRTLTYCATPLAPVYLAYQRYFGRDSWSRERYGYAPQPRPAGKLIWINGCSDGECAAARPLIRMLLAHNAGHVLLTSVAQTTGSIPQKKLPAGVYHQFLPLDTPAAVARFLDWWWPDIGLFIDSDGGPNLVMASHARGIPIAVINARMEKFSFRRWLMAPKTGHVVSGAFDAVLAQDKVFSARFRAVGARDVRVCGCLKADATPLAADEAALVRLRTAIGTRPVFLAAQTHGGEEAVLLSAHDLLIRRFPDMLTVIVPRHIRRGRKIARRCAPRSCALRSRGDAITEKTEIYVADTMGELGVFYRLVSFAFVGGSLEPLGSHNPIEPAQLGCAVLAGPYISNFKTSYRAIYAAQGTHALATAEDIAEQVAGLLDNPDKASFMGKMAAASVVSLRGATRMIAAYVEGVLNRESA